MTYYSTSTALAAIASFSFGDQPARVAVTFFTDAPTEVSLSLTAAEAGAFAEQLLEAVRAIPAAL